MSAAVKLHAYSFRGIPELDLMGQKMSKKTKSANIGEHISSWKKTKKKSGIRDYDEKEQLFPSFFHLRSAELGNGRKKWD